MRRREEQDTDADTGDSQTSADGPSDEEDYSNGRFEIFKRYISHWNLTGHDEMGVELPDGSLSVHAHNTYLQVIHDHGLITGAVYLLLGIVSLIQMFRYALTLRQTGRLQDRENPRDDYAALPLAAYFWPLLLRGWWSGCSIPVIRWALPRWRCWRRSLHSEGKRRKE